MKKNYKSTRIEMEGRTFQVEFWEEPCGSVILHYVCVSEIIFTEAKSFWLFRKTKTYEYKHEIGRRWGASNRVEWAMNEIANYLLREKKHMKDRMKDYQDIEDFCNGILL